MTRNNGFPQELMRRLNLWLTSEGLRRFEIEMWAYYRKDMGVLANWRNICKAPLLISHPPFSTTKIPWIEDAGRVLTDTVYQLGGNELAIRPEGKILNELNETTMNLF